MSYGSDNFDEFKGISHNLLIYICLLFIVLQQMEPDPDSFYIFDCLNFCIMILTMNTNFFLQGFGTSFFRLQPVFLICNFLIVNIIMLRMVPR